jgi:hypothetical protein
MRDSRSRRDATREQKLAHVRHVKQAGGGACMAVLGDDAVARTARACRSRRKAPCGLQAPDAGRRGVCVEGSWSLSCRGATHFSTREPGPGCEAPWRPSHGGIMAFLWSTQIMNVSRNPSTGPSASSACPAWARVRWVSFSPSFSVSSSATRTWTIQAREGRTLQEIVDSEGTWYLREIEESVLLDVPLEGRVAATGGSVIYSEAHHARGCARPGRWSTCVRTSKHSSACRRQPRARYRQRPGTQTSRTSTASALPSTSATPRTWSMRPVATPTPLPP